jgi:hypothetical protein
MVQRDQFNILVPAASRSALKLTQSPVQWVQGAVHRMKQPFRKTDYQTPSISYGKNAYSYISCLPNFFLR